MYCIVYAEAKRPPQQNQVQPQTRDITTEERRQDTHGYELRSSNRMPIPSYRKTPEKGRKNIFGFTPVLTESVYKGLDATYHKQN